MEQAIVHKLQTISKYYDLEKKGFLTKSEARTLIQDFFRFFPMTLKYRSDKVKMNLMIKNILDIVTEFNANIKEVKINLVVRILMLLCKRCGMAAK